MEKKQDRRVRKTKGQLENALLTIMKKKYIKDISVKELVDLADINRSTFYLHYNNISDILEEMEQRLLEQITEVFQRHPDNYAEDDTFSFISDLLHLLFENLETCKVIFGPHGDMSFTKKVQSLLGDVIYERLKLQEGKDFEISKYLSAFYINGCMGILNIWQYDENRINPDQMAKLCYALVMNTINGIKNLPEYISTLSVLSPKPVN